MPTNFSTSIFGTTASVDDLFVTADSFRRGNLWVWGYNYYGQLGDNTTTQRNIPVTTFLGEGIWKQVASGNTHTTAIKTDGTLWTWGTNSYGELGVNDANSRTTPVTTFAGGTNWKQVAGGFYHTAAVKTDGTLWTWGRNNQGQTGDNTLANRSTPITTSAGGTNWKQVACGGYFTAAIKTDGTLWTWGSNTNGRLGDNTTTQRRTPVTTFAGGTNWKQVTCSASHTVAIKTDGTLWDWGNNGSGQIGINDTTQRNTPVTTFLGGTNWKQVGCGDLHVAAIKTDGTLWTWGYNAYAALGIGPASGINMSTPVTTFAGGTNWKQVSAGRHHTVAVKTDGTLWTWGRNGYGQLGNNTSSFASRRSTPVTTFAGGTNWKQVTGGYASTFAVTYIDDYQ